MTPVSRLSDWFERFHRKLPWRESPRPYFVWISEIMLQQTQVATVVPYFERFIKRFPTVKALATAPLEDVLSEWAGLGYYSRARNLHKGACFIMHERNGRLPRTREEWLKVPGIGPYTAGVITSIAYDLPSPIVDGNVQRVFSRYYAIRSEIERTENQRFFWEKAEQWVKESASPRILNQALMELGATVCTKSSPRCERCPIYTDCLAFKKGIQGSLPVKKTRVPSKELFWITLLIQAGDFFYLQRNKPGQWWSDLWDIPRFDAQNVRAMEPSFLSWLDKTTGVVRWRPLARQKHTVTHHRIHVSAYHVELRRKLKIEGFDGQWVKRIELSSLPVSSLVRKVMQSAMPPLKIEG